MQAKSLDFGSGTWYFGEGSRRIATRRFCDGGTITATTTTFTTTTTTQPRPHNHDQNDDHNDNNQDDQDEQNKDDHDDATTTTTTTTTTTATTKRQRCVADLPDGSPATYRTLTLKPSKRWMTNLPDFDAKQGMANPTPTLRSCARVHRWLYKA